MTREEFIVFMQKVDAKCLAEATAKNADYSKTGGSNDAFGNFKFHGNQLGLDKYIIWYIYFSKHFDAIKTFIKEKDISSEIIEGRCMDAIVYLKLLWGMIEEDRNERAQVSRFPSK